MNTLGYTSHPLSETYPAFKPLTKEHPRDFMYRISCEKMRRLTSKAPSDSLLITATKIVACGRRILTPPESLEEARSMISLLSGRRHQVLTLISLKYQETLKHREVLTRISFKRLSPQEIEDYLQGEAWRYHAGGYDILGRAASFIKAMNGSIGGIWGVPVYELTSLLGGFQNELRR